MIRCSASKRGHKTDAARERCPVCRTDRATRTPTGWSNVPPPRSMDVMPDGSNVAVERNAAGDVKSRKWLRGGVPHREDGPAIITYRANGTILTEEWCLNGERHREDGPAETHFHEGGAPARETWALHGKTHREDGPAIIAYREDGSVKEEFWLLHDRFDRPDGPASVEYRDDGSVRRERWLVDFDLHREDGPAEIEYGFMQAVESEDWYWHNNPMTDLQVRAPGFGIARSNTEVLDLLDGFEADDLTPEHPSVVLALQLFPND